MQLLLPGFYIALPQTAFSLRQRAFSLRHSVILLRRIALLLRQIAFLLRHSVILHRQRAFLLRQIAFLHRQTAFSHCQIAFSLRQAIISLRPSLLKSIYETYRSTRTVSRLSSASNPTVFLPTVGYLSIVVASTTRQGGIGTRLLTAPETALQRKGVEHYKVVAGSKLTGANRFYRKNGFEKVARVKIHGEEESNVYVKRVG